jgi:hypothetical protein
LLLDILQTHGQLEDSRHLSAGEKLMIFLYILCNNPQRQACELFQHSLDTIHNALHQVKYSILFVKDRLMRPYAGLNQPVSDIISNNPKFWPYFRDCIGAVDGSHIPIQVFGELASRCRNHKQFLSQNILGACNFDLTYAYILAGWEGSAHDQRVFNFAKDHGLPMFEGKYYLGDCGYSLSRLVLVPYRGVRYHLKEWGQGNEKPQNRKELFNLRHSSLRNAVERIFGVTKKRFPILTKFPTYDYDVVTELIQCCFLLHNFIRINEEYEDQFYAEYDNEDQDEGEDGDDDNEPEGALLPGHAQAAAAMRLLRDQIADEMWVDYQQYLLDHPEIN